MDPTDPRLKAVAIRIEPLIESVATKGIGAAEFILLKGNARACEVSIDDGKFWVEFWSAGPEEDSPPVRDANFESEDDVMSSVLQWLTTDGDKT